MSPLRHHTLASGPALRRENGQAVVFSLLFLTVILGVAGLVIDVGSWLHSDRQAQATADAAALAGAQALPDDPAQGTALASTYASKNGGGLNKTAITTKLLPNDTIQVTIKRQAPSFFTKILGISSVQVGAVAAARASTLAQAKYVAPIVVKNTHPKLSCLCFGPANTTTIPLDKQGAPGAFGLLNLDNQKGGSGPPVLADWILNGYQDFLPLGDYYSDPGAKFNSSQVDSALTARIGTVLLFPVFDTLNGDGANAQYHIIGWAGFHLTGFSAQGNDGTVSGYFSSVVWTGIAATTTQPFFGIKGVSLVE
ncbi:MAG: hypothetical protein E6G67_03060 [Actinobacteria bacterium]|nr:MAG: hypothetical protein E6G67_03060 [Actinomycetota bacterium]